jgi:hypothetical protein
MRHHCLVEQAKLQAEIYRIQAYRGNGKGGRAVETPKTERKS